MHGPAGYMVAHEILVSAPVPFGFRSYWDLVGVRPRGFGTKGLGTGLDNYESEGRGHFDIGLRGFKTRALIFKIKIK